MRRKFEMDILLKNGYGNLSEELKTKFDRYESSASGVKVSSILDFNEFCEILSKTTFLLHLRYQNIVYDIDRYDGTYGFFSDGGKNDDGKNISAFSYQYTSLAEFIKRAQINGFSICELWDEILID